MKLFLKIILSVIIVFVLVIAGGVFYITRGLDAGSKMVINTVDILPLEDGEYTGKHDAGRFSNEIKVMVKDHKITKVDVVKDVTFSRPEVTQELVSKVIEKQSIDVDTVTGATVTCKAYLKAIENALAN